MFDCRFACPNCGREHRIPEPHLVFVQQSARGVFSLQRFWPHTDIDEGLVVPDPTKTLKNGAIDPFSKPSFSDWQDDLFRFAERHGISIGKRYRELTAGERKLSGTAIRRTRRFLGFSRASKISKNLNINSTSAFSSAATRARHSARFAKGRG